MKRTLPILLALLGFGGLFGLSAVVLAGHGGPHGEVLVQEALPAVEPTEDHDLAVISFEKLFVGTVISGDTLAFSFEIVNQDLLPDRAGWSIGSDNATTGDTGDDITIASGDADLASGFSLRTGPGGISWDTAGSALGVHSVTLSVAPVPGEPAGNNSKALTVAIIGQPDVEVTSVVPTTSDGVTPISPGDVVVGGTVVNVGVTVVNHSPTPASFLFTFTVALTGDGDEDAIANLNVTLDGGEDVILGVIWGTPVAKPGEYVLTARATVTGDLDTGDNSKSVTVTLILAPAVSVEGADASLQRSLADPGVATQVEPLATTFFTGQDATLPRSLTRPTIAAQVEPLATTFFTGQDATLPRSLTRPTIDSQVEPLATTFFTGQDATLPRSLTWPTIAAQAEPLATTFFTGQDAALPRSLTRPTIAAQAELFATTFFTGQDAALPRLLTRPEVNTQSGPPDASFVTGADASLGRALAEPGIATVAEPFTEDAIIQNGSGIHLQGSPTDSTGAFMRVNGQNHFVSAEGMFSITVDPGTFTIQIRAPGYLSVDIVSPSGSSVVLGSGDVLTVPELTMVYGDANGDGAIDVRDLALGGRNFGETPGELELTPQ